jgi:lipid A 3-O-deacylase
MFTVQKLVRPVVASVLCAAACLAQPAFAQSLFDSAAVEAGGGEHLQVLRLSAQSNWNKNWFPMNGYHLSGYWDVNAAWWRANRWRDVPERRHNLAVVGITPVFRVEADDRLGLYGEAAIGVALFSDVYQNTHRTLSTAFEFADHVGVGYVFANKWDLGARIQHYSNGGIKHPNGGVNLFTVRLARPF